ncbi:MAG: substrate-binding domain-containing protein, partial [Thermomicrobiales bacterium]
HDDTPARSARPAMTTIHVDRAQWGQVAAECLLHILGGRPSRGSRLLLPVRLIERESTGPAAGQR